MIVSDIVSNLGNQLFIYAATKSIALDLGYQYSYRVIRPSFASQDSCIDDYGHEYTSEFEIAFHIDTSERIVDLPPQIIDCWTWKGSSLSYFDQDVYKISDNTQLCGYFISPKYFGHRKNEVLDWFRFTDTYTEKCKNICKQIILSTNATHLVSIHMRYGKDHRFNQITIDPSYYKLALERMEKIFPDERLCYLLFSDEVEESKRLLELDNIVTPKGTMFEDLCLMSLCDSHIISSSTFSWWGAWLGQNPKGITIRPSNCPITKDKYAPSDRFPTEWISVESEREKITLRIFFMRFRYNFTNEILKFSFNGKQKIKKILKRLFKLEFNKTK